MTTTQYGHTPANYALEEVVRGDWIEVSRFGASERRARSVLGCARNIRAARLVHLRTLAVIYPGVSK
jgi:hypothetical protein